MFTACAVLCLAGPVQGQLIVRPVQNLSFGLLIPGVPTVVDALQFTRSGHIEVGATIGAIFEIRYTLPTVMNGPGATLPLVFGTSSAGASASRTPSTLIRFNPNAAASFRFVTTDRASFFLGGEARPAIGQALGNYSAPIIVTITNLGT